jgi:hypothetical protein
MTHTELCFLGAKWLKSHGIVRWNKPKYVVVEITCLIPCEPDIFGFGCDKTQQIEVKVSRSDFLADLKKSHRIYPANDVGDYRSYLCPAGIIKESDLPKGWGLLYVDNNNKITEVVKPEIMVKNSRFEMNIIDSIMRRIEIKPQIFSFKNYKVDTQLKLLINS